MGFCLDEPLSSSYNKVEESKRGIPGIHKLTINDIAKIANVSKATVSRVINNKPLVKPELRERIQQIMEEHDYHPDALAQAMAFQATHTIALGIPSNLEGVLNNSFYTRMISSIVETVNENGYYLLFAHPSLRVYEDMINHSRVDGFIILSSNNQHKELIKLLKSKSVPYVSTSALIDPESVYVDIDNYEAGRLAGHYLVRHGHRRIAYVYQEGFSSSSERGRGLEAAMKEHGLSLEPRYRIAISQSAFTEGYRVAESLLSITPRPTAVFTCNDFIAQGILQYCENMNLKMPESLSVIGIDNDYLDDRVRPALTSINQNVSECGRQATKLLIQMLREHKTPPTITLPATLVERKSVATI